jgi:hypothetical protein
MGTGTAVGQQVRASVDWVKEDYSSTNVLWIRIGMFSNTWESVLER